MNTRVKIHYRDSSLAALTQSDGGSALTQSDEFSVILSTHSRHPEQSEGSPL